MAFPIVTLISPLVNYGLSIRLPLFDNKTTSFWLFLRNAKQTIFCISAIEDFATRKQFPENTAKIKGKELRYKNAKYAYCIKLGDFHKIAKVGDQSIGE